MFQPILASWVEVGKALIREMFLRIKNNFDDHEARINTLEFGSSKIVVFNNDVLLTTSSVTYTGVAYFVSPFDFVIQQAEVQLLGKGGITTGTLQIDFKKNTTPDNAGMTSIFTTLPSINFASATEYQISTNQVLDPGQSTIAIGDVIRFDITSIPAALGKFRIVLIGGV